jgi:hypothetical protein
MDRPPTSNSLRGMSSAIWAAQRRMAGTRGGACLKPWRWHLRWQANDILRLKHTISVHEQTEAALGEEIRGLHNTIAARDRALEAAKTEMQTMEGMLQTLQAQTEEAQRKEQKAVAKAHSMQSEVSGKDAAHLDQVHLGTFMVVCSPSVVCWGSGVRGAPADGQ